MVRAKGYGPFLEQQCIFSGKSVEQARELDNCKTTVMIIAEFMCYNNHPVFLTVHSAAAIHDTNLQHTEGAFCGSPKSGDYGVDVLAKKGGRICAIQCKKFNETNPIPPKYVQQLLGGMN